jgi:hypothetical protein
MSSKDTPVTNWPVIWEQMRRQHRLTHQISPACYRKLEELAAKHQLSTMADTLQDMIDFYDLMTREVFEKPGRQLAVLDENGKLLWYYKG